MTVDDGATDDAFLRNTYVQIDIFVCVMGSLFSFLLIMLILDMRIWNDYMKLIFSMTVFQFLYDISLCNDILVPTYYNFVGVWGEIINLIGGVSSFIISNIISFTVFYVLYFKQTFDLKQNLYYVVAAVLIPNLIWMLIVLVGLFETPINANLMETGFLLTAWLRLFPTIFNFLFFIMNNYIVRKITAYREKSMSGYSESELAMITLTERMKWYPIAQSISRICFTWYEFEYGFNFEYFSKQDPLRYGLNAAGMLSTLCSPVGFFVIFVVMQPKAQKHIMWRLGVSSGRSAFSPSPGSANDIPSSNIDSGVGKKSGASGMTEDRQRKYHGADQTIVDSEAPDEEEQTIDPIVMIDDNYSMSSADGDSMSQRSLGSNNPLVMSDNTVDYINFSEMVATKSQGSRSSGSNVQSNERQIGRSSRAGSNARFSSTGSKLTIGTNERVSISSQLKYQKMQKRVKALNDEELISIISKVRTELPSVLEE